MELSFDTGNSTQRHKCPDCKSKYLLLKRFITDRGSAFAVCFIEAHRHNHDPELYFTATLGDWGGDSTNDHITFACRYGSVIGQDTYACSLMDVPESFENSLTGKKLTRNEGLAHEKINEFWHVVDFLLESDKDIHDFLHHPRKSKFRARLFR